MINTIEYVVIIEKTDTGYSAYVPDLLGCITVGGTREETTTYMKGAVQLHLEGLREDGLEIPAPNTEATTVAA